MGVMGHISGEAPETQAEAVTRAWGWDNDLSQSVPPGWKVVNLNGCTEAQAKAGMYVDGSGRLVVDTDLAESAGGSAGCSWSLQTESYLVPSVFGSIDIERLGGSTQIGDAIQLSFRLQDLDGNLVNPPGGTNHVCVAILRWSQDARMAVWGTAQNSSNFGHLMRAGIQITPMGFGDSILMLDAPIDNTFSSSSGGVSLQDPRNPYDGAIAFDTHRIRTRVNVQRGAGGRVYGRIPRVMVYGTEI